MDEEIRTRHFDRSSRAYQSKEPGTIIKSMRKFGVEAEMYHKSRAAVGVLSKTIAKVFGIEHDGSIDAGSGTGVEVVSPILCGGKGEEAVVDMFKTINSLGFKINKTCGLHVHLDGAGFAKTKETDVIQLGLVESSKMLSSLSEARGDYAFVVKRDVMNCLGERLEAREAAQLIADEHLTRPGDSIFLSKELGLSVPEIVRRSCVHQIGKTRAMLDMFCFDGDVSEEEAVRGVSITPHTPSPDDLLCIVYGQSNLSNILTLLYLHTVFSDVFMAMLPMSRRQDNLYCQSLSLGFSANQIEHIMSYTELEAAWYKTRTVNETRRRKGNNYDDSRYFSINLHSLFAKYGTIEVRSHTATLDPNKVLYWVAFHQEILDRIVSGDITIGALSEGAHIADIDEKTDFLQYSLGLRPELQKYMQQRIDYFKNKEK